MKVSSPLQRKERGFFWGPARLRGHAVTQGVAGGVAGLKTNLEERTSPPGENVSILSHSAFSVIEEVQLSGFCAFP